MCREDLLPPSGLPTASAKNQWMVATEYVLGNPLHYTDPTGHFTEQQILDIFGVKTWDEVYAMFGKGRIYEGKPGLLDLLFTAKEGDEISAVLGHGIDQNGWAVTNKELLGNAKIEDGALYFEKDGARTSALLELATSRYDEIEIRHNPGAFANGHGWPIESYTSVWLDNSTTRRFDPSRLDRVGLGLDVAGFGLSIFGAAAPAKAAGVAEKAGYIVSAIGAGRSLTVNEDPAGAILTVGGALPFPPVSIPSGVIAILRDLAPAIVPVP